MTGEVAGGSVAQAAATLADRGLFPVRLDIRIEASRRPAAPRGALAIVFRSIAALVEAGVPLERAVAATEPLARGGLRNALADVREALHQGQSLAQALAGSQGAIPGVVVGMVRAGERGSRLGAALEQVAAHLEHEAELVARVRQALAYPLLLAVAGTISVFVIGTVVVPRFADLLADLGQSLPLATRLLLTGSMLLRRFWPMLVALAAGSLFAAVEVLARPGARRVLDGWVLRLPVVGSLRLGLATARVTRALSGMLAAGMPLLAALEAASDAAGNLAVGDALRKARERVAQGEPLARALERERAATPAALQLVAVGEASGRLPEMMARAGNLAARESERQLKTLVTMLEPALIVAFGGLVAFVAAALLQAVYSLRPGGL
ncbi:MAG TPA: type II secretion system F family protein [Gemmatimonadales bacterium]|nr:type II secretion system F family protein [Gemmatimonadales bacterium]